MNNNELAIFKSEDFGEIRTIIIDGKPYFMANDIATALGYAKPNNAISTHCRATLKQGIPISGKIQECNFIPEGDVYRLILKSKLPSALRFESWVMDDVLPQIRQTGSYIPQQLTMQEMTLLVIEDLQNQVAAQKKTITVMQPKADFYDSMNRDTETTYTATSVAKLFGMTAQAFNKLLQSEKVQYKTDGHWVLRSDWDNKGLVIYVPKPFTRKDGSTGTKLSMVFTSHGLVWLTKSLAKRNIVPNDMSKIPDVSVDIKTF